jgi:hypothetical protein
MGWVQAVQGEGFGGNKGAIRQASATVTFRHVSKEPSETTIMDEGLSVEIPHARCQDYELSWVPASLANFVTIPPARAMSAIVAQTRRRPVSIGRSVLWLPARALLVVGPSTSVLL